ncbi:hypothetical protein E2C01_024363 [Portunus trituberculatus]|uniref:Uncharacterized protein n=1 Tax=Portunus trituberculatus TaxID=210409 RepID=A0A5B7ECL2_PORTR|nr:hypothetical protein [Portunus trituberculatus]
MDRVRQETKASMRRVIIQEIVTTEHEYIHDLESLLQVVQLAPSRPGGTQGVHLPSLLGNIPERKSPRSLRCSDTHPLPSSSLGAALGQVRSDHAAHRLPPPCTTQTHKAESQL